MYGQTGSGKTFTMMGKDTFNYNPSKIFNYFKTSFFF